MKQPFTTPWMSGTKGWLMLILDKQKIKTSHRAAQLLAFGEFPIVITEGVLVFCGCFDTLAQN